MDNELNTIDNEFTESYHKRPKSIKIIACTLALFTTATTIQLSLTDSSSLMQLISLACFTLAIPAFTATAFIEILSENGSVPYRFPRLFFIYFGSAIILTIVGISLLIFSKSIIIGILFVVSILIVSNLVLVKFFEKHDKANNALMAG